MRFGRIAVSIVILSLLAALTIAVQATPMGTAFTYQGKLTDPSGNPLSGSYNMSFKLFDALTDGGQVGSTVSLAGVNVSNGLFTVTLDFGPDAFVGEKRWLETVVAGETITPRSELTGAPGAMSVAPGGLGNYAGSIQNLASASATPVVVGTVGTGSNPYAVCVQGRYAYVTNGVSNTLQVIDLSNPAAPYVVGELPTEPSPGAVCVSGKYVYVLTRQNQSLWVIDISAPTAPVKVGGASTSDYPSSVCVSGRYLLVVNANSTSKGMQILDVSYPPSITQVSFFNNTGGHSPNSICVSGNYAYIVNGADTNNLHIVEITNPSVPESWGSVLMGGTTPTPMNVTVLGRYAYVVNYNTNTMQIIDISNRSNPALVGSPVSTGGIGPISVCVSGRYAYVVNYSSNNLAVIDVSNPSAPVLVGSPVSTGGIGPRSVCVSGRYAYVVNEGSNKLAVIDISGIETTALSAHSLEAGTLQVRGSAVIGNQLAVYGGLTVGASGNFAGAVSANGVSLTSDGLFKTNLEPLHNALATIERLRGVSFDWNRDAFKDRNFDEGRQIGFVAQEVEKVLPELVSKDPQGYRGVAYQNLVPVLVEAIKEQQKQISAKDARINALETRLKRVEKQLSKKGK